MAHRHLLTALLALTLLAACDDGDGSDGNDGNDDTSATDTATGDSGDTTPPGDTTTDEDVPDDTGGDDVTDTGADTTTDDTTGADTTGADTTGDGDLDDDGDVSVGATLLDCITGVAPEGQTVETMTLENADGSVQVGYARRVSGVGTGETWTFDLMRFGVVRDGQLECFDDPAQLEHIEGHHNWNETMTATADDDTVYTLRMMVSFDPEFTWTDWLESTGPRAFAAQVDLQAVTCETTPVPDDPNFCFNRTGTAP